MFYEKKKWDKLICPFCLNLSKFHSKNNERIRYICKDCKKTYTLNDKTKIQDKDLVRIKEILKERILKFNQTSINFNIEKYSINKIFKHLEKNFKTLDIEKEKKDFFGT